MMVLLNHMIYAESRTLNNPPLNTRIELLLFSLEKANRMAMLQNGHPLFTFSNGVVAIATEPADHDD